MKTSKPEINNRCKFCRKTGKYYSVDIEHGGTVPDYIDFEEITEDRAEKIIEHHKNEIKKI
jgi:hypothetical protein